MSVAAAARAARRPQVAYLIEPGFSGGTSAAVAAELRVVADLARIRLHAHASRMFSGAGPAPRIADVAGDLGLPLIRDAPVISADVVIVHNPVFLKFDESFAPRIICRQLIVVAHENFLLPGGGEAFDAGHCLALLEKASLAASKTVAPVSAHNRKTLEDWFAQPGRPHARAWNILPENWFNIADPAVQPPTRKPRDRRGRLSRPGVEKFPPLDDLEACFPPQAACNLILGADLLRAEAGAHPHWSLHDFGTMDPAQFYDQIDFLVHFTSPMWRESHGRVLAEATAAGKLVITDPETARNFGPGIVGAAAGEVSRVIAGFVENPKRYVDHVKLAQETLLRYAPERFGEFFQRVVPNRERERA